MYREGAGAFSHLAELAQAVKKETTGVGDAGGAGDAEPRHKKAPVIERISLDDLKNGNNNSVMEKRVLKRTRPTLPCVRRLFLG